MGGRRLGEARLCRRDDAIHGLVHRANSWWRGAVTARDDRAGPVRREPFRRSSRLLGASRRTVYGGGRRRANADGPSAHGHADDSAWARWWEGAGDRDDHGFGRGGSRRSAAVVAGLSPISRVG